MKEKYFWVTIVVILIVLLSVSWGFSVRANQARSTPIPLPLGKKGPILDENGVEMHPTSTPNVDEAKNLPFSLHPYPTPVKIIKLAPEETGERYEVIIKDRNNNVQVVLKVPNTINKDEVLKRISGKYYFPEKGEEYFISPPAPQFSKVRERSNEK